MELKILYLEIVSISFSENILISVDVNGNKMEYDITGLEILNCCGNQLTTLPNLPEGLKSLICNGNRLSALPNFPAGLKRLNCHDNRLTSLPKLPTTIKTLDCSKNQLTSLPKLPEGLTSLYCRENQLTSLPKLPEGLINLFCYENQLELLPKLPKGLKSLNCFQNRLLYIEYLKRKPLYYEVPSHLKEKHSAGTYQRNYVLQTLNRYLVYFLIQRSKYYKTFRVFNEVLSGPLL